MTNKSLIYKQIPKGVPVPGQDLVIEDRPIDLDSPPNGGLTLEILYVSFDPYQRGRMRDQSVKSYAPPYVPDEPVTNDAVARVLKSDSPDFGAGDIVLANRVATAEYIKVSADQLKSQSGRPAAIKKLENPHDLDLGLFLGPLGMPGLTAYSGLKKIGQPKKGETILVSSAAGAVGQLVGQLAKRMGLRVLGSVGSEEKKKYVKEELGFDEAFNYKEEKPSDALSRLAPDGIDIYWENVGGEHLEAALTALKTQGRIVVCGMISEYNTPIAERKGVRGLQQVVAKQLLMQGFLVFNPEYGPAHAKDHIREVSGWLADGSLSAKLSVTDGIDNAADGLVGMLQGKNFGKAVLKIRD